MRWMMGLVLVACGGPAVEGDVITDTGGDTGGCVPSAAIEDCETPEDDDCSGTTNDEGGLGCEDYWVDADGDGIGADDGTPRCLCEAEGEYTSQYPNDCDDADDSIYLNAAEVCDGVDNDCDGEIDEDDAQDRSTWFIDEDGDGYGGLLSTLSCDQPTGYVADGTDCDDDNAEIHPGATEHCDGIESDCDNSTPDTSLATVLWDGEPHFSSYDLQQVLDHMSEGDEARLCPGTYTGNFTATNGGKLVGWEGAEATVLDGAGTGSVITVAEAGDLRLEGLTITNGLGSPFGGGVNAWGHTPGALWIKDCVIEGNAARYGAGVAVAADGGGQIDSTVIRDNVAADDGGGLMLGAGEFSLVDVTIEANQASQGGGVAVDGATLYGSPVQITGNTATLGAGAFVTGGGLLSIATSEVSQNTATDGGGGCALDPDADNRVESTNTDWGSGSTDNDPDDIYMSWDVQYSYDSGETFTCSADTQSCD